MERWRCGKCNINYRVGPPTAKGVLVDRWLCSDCEQPFWEHGSGHAKGEKVVVGVEVRPEVG